MIVSILLLIVGFVVLIGGADFLVRGASSFARKLNISPVVIGLTVVAFGTSMPELIVNTFSAFKQSTDIAIGNIVGSNISNVFLVLGISAMIYPLSVKKNTTYKEIPFALLGAILVFTMGNDALFNGGGSVVNSISRTDGISFLAMFIIFMYYTFGISRVQGETNEVVKTYSGWLSFIFVFGGSFLLFLGGMLLVDNAIILAEMAGLSEALIGLTVVAIGTSLPELATSIMAALKKQTDIAIGNIVGSNIFNVFWILGVTAVIYPLPFNEMINFDVLIGIICALFLFLFMFVGKKHVLQRWQGAMFVLFYLSYLGFLIYRG